jgi:hypothetical protein
MSCGRDYRPASEGEREYGDVGGEQREGQTDEPDRWGLEIGG